ncbi:hypothetical protein [uncultured Chitinophaga sp.]|jgi:hypothetical protein|uniref:hypothetical protein n=1 Tax=uncultured Chitinophaga sp. TaxID=339340 RepID=UPI002626895D|nr:hypothetical protein [uncultured Chitinophaga sp.]
MSKQCGPVYITGTVKGICYYRMNGKYYARRKSTLSRKRVKRDRAFALTRKYAALLGQASAIAAQVYRLLPKAQKKLDLYRAMTGQAIGMLKQGMNEGEIKARLEQDMNGTKVTVAAKPLVRMHSKTEGMHVVRTVWRKGGKGLVDEGKGRKVPPPVWRVMTGKREYEVKVGSISNYNWL